MGKETSRNDPCPCGSGNKYKHCCIDKPAPGGGARRSSVALVLLAVAAAVAGVLVGMQTDSRTGLAIGGGGVIVAGIIGVLLRPPPPKQSAADPAGLNFGRDR